MTDQEKYAFYLNSREWGVLRAKVKRRSDGVCERCNQNEMTHTHHLTYIRKYNERLEDLQGVCTGCHEFIHGHSNVDPAVRPLLSLNGREIKSVYLAGTCAPKQISCDRHDASPDNWRKGITDAFFVGHKNKIPARINDAIVVNGTKLGYVGPFIYYEHNVEQFMPHGDGGSKADGGVLGRCRQGILDADLLFAWIDREDCYGTLAEIGYAAGLRDGPEIAIAGPQKFGELWFVYELADQINLAVADAGSAFVATFRNDGGTPIRTAARTRSVA